MDQIKIAFEEANAEVNNALVMHNSNISIKSLEDFNFLKAQIGNLVLIIIFCECYMVFVYYDLEKFFRKCLNYSFIYEVILFMHFIDHIIFYIKCKYANC